MKVYTYPPHDVGAEKIGLAVPVINSSISTYDCRIHTYTARLVKVKLDVADILVNEPLVWIYPKSRSYVPLSGYPIDEYYLTIAAFIEHEALNTLYDIEKDYKYYLQ